MNNRKYNIGYTTGVFDMFHIGHLNILRKSKELCDYLIVGVTTDNLCKERKGKNPIICFQDRCAILEAIKYVDAVVPQDNMNKMEAVAKLGCDVVFVGSDWQNTSQWDTYEKQFESIGCEVVYLSYTDGISSTILRDRINRNKNGHK